MANRNFNRFQALSKELKLIDGSFCPNGTSAVNNALNTGIGFTVARTSTGLFTITLQDNYVSLHSVTASLQLETASDKIVQVGTTAVSTTAKTIQLRIWDISDAAVADVSYDANNRVNFQAVLKNSTVGG